MLFGLKADFMDVCQISQCRLYIASKIRVLGAHGKWLYHDIIQQGPVKIESEISMKLISNIN